MEGLFRALSNPSDSSAKYVTSSLLLHLNLWGKQRKTILGDVGVRVLTITLAYIRLMLQFEAVSKGY